MVLLEVLCNKDADRAIVSADFVDWVVLVAKGTWEHRDGCSRE